MATYIPFARNSTTGKFDIPEGYTGVAGYEYKDAYGGPQRYSLYQDPFGGRYQATAPNYYDVFSAPHLSALVQVSGPKTTNPNASTYSPEGILQAGINFQPGQIESLGSYGAQKAQIKYTPLAGETLAQYNTRTGANADYVGGISDPSTKPGGSASLPGSPGVPAGPAPGTDPSFGTGAGQVPYPTGAPAGLGFIGASSPGSPGVPALPAPLPSTQPPSSAANITNNFSSTSIPSTQYSGGNISGALGGTAGVRAEVGSLEKMIADERARALAAEQTRQTESQSLLTKYLGSTTSPADARAKAQAETGINSADYFTDQKTRIAEIGTLTEEYNNVKMMKDQQLAATQDKLASNSFINNQSAQIERNAAPKLNQLSANINSKAAVLQALQGRFNEAQDYVRQAVADATADTRYKMDVYKEFYKLNEDNFDRVESIYSNSFKQSLALAEDQYRIDVANKTKVGNLMLDNPQAGILITDSLETAYQKAGLNQTTSYTSGSTSSSGTSTPTSASPLYTPKDGVGSISPDGQWKYTQSGWTSNVAPTTTSSGKSIFSQTQINNGASNAGLSLDSFSQLSNDVKNYYINAPSSQIADINTTIQSVRDGSASAEDVIKQIKSSGASPEVVSYLTKIVNDIPQSDIPTTWWDSLKGIFGY